MVSKQTVSIAGLLLLWQAIGTPWALPFAWGDALLLKNGGELRGELLAPTKPAGRESASMNAPLTMRTTTGAVVTVSRDEVEEIIHRRPLLEEYETLRRAAADTVEAQWELAEWCRSKSLTKERASRLARIVELDPNHAAARRGLGHVRHEGRWTTTDELMTARGYIKRKGKYVLPQELELIEAEEHADAAEKGWFKRIKLWETWLDSDRTERQAEGLHELQAIRDGHAVAALARNFKDDPNEQKRLLYIEILMRIEGEKPLIPLVQQSLRDESQLVRSAAIRGARRKDAGGAIEIYLRALRNEQNVVVNRAGTALGEMGDDSVVPQLIEALVTRHRYRVVVPDGNVAFGADGSMASGGVPLPPDVALLLRTGQLPFGVQVQGDGLLRRTREVTIQQDEQNPSVLSSLNRLTGEDFGFDEQAWRHWQRARVGGTLKAKPRKSTKASS